MDTLNIGEEVDYVTVLQTAGRGKVVAVDAVAIRLEVISKHRIDATFILPWSHIASLKVIPTRSTDEAE
jgi:hypothetical protein